MRARSATRSTASACGRPTACSDLDRMLDVADLETIDPMDVLRSRVFSGGAGRAEEYEAMTEKSSSRLRSWPPISRASARRSRRSTLPAPTGSTVDVMDGHFVPNISYGPASSRRSGRRRRRCFDVHLMIAPADPYLEAFAKAGADIITVHAEAGPHLDRSLQAIRALGKKAGVACVPRPRKRDRVCARSSRPRPGDDGQSGLRRPVLPRLPAREDRAHSKHDRRPADPARGRRRHHARQCRRRGRCGRRYLVAGSAVFRGKSSADYAGNIAAIRAAAEAGRVPKLQHSSAQTIRAGEPALIR